ncbi:MAG: DinB family protein [Gemmataceae bacterium]|nr:DinB family protein [Gemmataceae bacterium]
MNAKDPIIYGLKSTQNMMGMYLADLSDADLVVRPAPGANHIAWQLGHLIHSEARLASIVSGAAFPELPAGFGDQHGPKTAAVDPPQGFGSKKEYLDLFTKVREASIVLAVKVNDSELDKPNTGPLAAFAPKIGDLFVLLANHSLMHMGQFSVVRRKLGKPVLF